jgi:hypothetical protein
LTSVPSPTTTSIYLEDLLADFYVALEDYKPAKS